MDPNTKDILETVNFIKDNMATKDDIATLQQQDEELHQEIVSKIGGLHKRLDEELDKRKVLEVRVTRIEEKTAS